MEQVSSRPDSVDYWASGVVPSDSLPPHTLARKAPKGAWLMASGSALALALVSTVILVTLRDGSRTDSMADFRKHANAACESDYRSLQQQAANGSMTEAGALQLSIAGIERMARDVNALPHPASVSAALAKIQRDSDQLSQFAQAHQAEIASLNSSSPDISTVVSMINSLRQDYEDQELNQCVSP
jgi:hypothetical protein